MLDTPLVYLFVIGFGLVIGSFLNVVIYRLPLQLEAGWKRDARAILGQEMESKVPLNLAFPASHCPHCQKPLKIWHNIPILSYLWLKGRCAYCEKPIAIQYPLVELVTAVAGVVVVNHFGLGPQGLLALLFTITLIALIGIDFNTQLLPDTLTLPLLWLGLLANSQGLFTDLPSAVYGAVGGYLVLWSIYWLFKLATGKEGMGYGDFKLLAALGAWMGWQQLPLILLLSSLVGAIIGLVAIAIAGRDRHIPMAFGPYLGIAGWVALLWGEAIADLYLGLF